MSEQLEATGLAQVTEDVRGVRLWLASSAVRRACKGSRPAKGRTSAAFVVGVVIVGLFAAVAVFAPILAPFSPTAQSAHILASPSLHHLLGTDELGRDILSRIIYGARIDLLIGLLGSAGAAAIGTCIGLISGYAGGFVDVLLTRLMDMVQAVPFLVLAPVLLLVLGTHVQSIVIAFAVSAWVTYARLTRSKVMVIRDLDYVKAAVLGGLPRTRVVASHVFANVLPEVLVFLTIDIVIQIGAISALGFIGLGVQPPTAEWGAIMYAGRPFLGQEWWIVVSPGIAIVILGIGLSLIAERLLAHKAMRELGG